MKELKTIRDLFQAISDGYEIEYQIKPTKPSINWDHVHPRYNYLARDENGAVFLYAKEPYKITNQWSSDGSVVCKATSHISMSEGTCCWSESLVKRPDVKEVEQ